MYNRLFRMVLHRSRTFTNQQARLEADIVVAIGHYGASDDQMKISQHHCHAKGKRTLSWCQKQYSSRVWSWGRSKLVGIAKKNPRMTRKELVKKMSFTGVNVTRKTVTDTIRSEGLCKYQVKRVPLLKKSHLEACKEFAVNRLKKEDIFRWNSVVRWHRNWFIWQ